MMQQNILATLAEVDPDDRAEAAGILQARLAARGQLDFRTAMFLRMVATGRVNIVGEGFQSDDGDDDDDDDDSDYAEDI